jgi:hypothetical protein
MIAAHPKYVAADTAVVAALVRYAGVRTEIGARHHRAEFTGQSEIQTFIARRTREREIEQDRRKPALPFLK